MKSLVTKAAQVAFVISLGLTATACSVIDLSDLSLPNPFASADDVPPAANPTTAASTYIGPAPTNGTDPFGAPTGAGFSDPMAAGSGKVAPGSDPRPMDPTAARAYDMIVERAQATCAVAPLIVGFGRVNGGYNANASCPAASGANAGFSTPGAGFSFN